MRRESVALCLLTVSCALLVVGAQSSLFTDHDVSGHARGLKNDAHCERIPRCKDCEMDKDDDARTIRVCTLCEDGYQPSKDYGKTCGE